MRLKTFIAKTTPEAMRMVTKELGQDAVIVSNRKTPEGMVKITAALDNVDVADEWEVKAEKIVSDKKYDSESESHVEENDLVDIVTSCLLKHNTPATVSDKIIAALQHTNKKKPLYALADALAEVFGFASLETDEAWKRPLIIVGIPGTGKTLTVAKLAAGIVIAGGKPLVITADTMRAGAMEQLNSFMRVLNLKLHTVTHWEELLGLLVRNGDATQVIIDSQGINPFNVDEMKELTSYIRAKDMDVALAVSGGTDAEEASEIARAFKLVGAKYLIPTRLDMARRIGGILAAAAHADLSFAGAGNAPGAAGGLYELTPLELARFLLPQKYHDTGNGKKA